MSGGHTDALVLQVPLVWWPTLGCLRRFPLDGWQSFAAAVSAEGVEVGAPPSHSVALSRLGRSVLCGARWAEAAGGGAAVSVRDPFTDEQRVLRVCGGPSGVSLRALAEEGRVRMAPMPLAEWAALPTIPAAGAATTDYMLEPYVRSIQLSVDKWLARRGTGVHSVLITGDAGSGKSAVVARWLHLLPRLLPLGEGGSCAVLVRWLRLTDVLALAELDAVAALEALLEPVPTAAGARSLVVLCVEELDLLQGHANGLVDVVSYEWMSRLDSLARASLGSRTGGWCAFLTVSTAISAEALPEPLLARLAVHTVAVTRPTAAERRRRLEQLLPSLSTTEAAAADDDDEDDSAVLRAAVVDSFTGATMGELARLTPEEVGRRLGEVRERARLAARADPYGHLYAVQEAVSRLEELVVWPLANRGALAAAHLDCGKGALLCGPSGSGRTALLAALRVRLRQHPGTQGVHVVSQDGLSLIDKEVGRSEKNIAALFATARRMAPCVVFLDNLDALAPPRGRQTSETTTATDRTLSTLLTEMDGVDGDPSRVVVVVASAPSLAALDAAVCRPGRLDAHIQLCTPSREATAEAMEQRLHAFARSVAATFGKCDLDACAAAVRAGTQRYLSGLGTPPTAAEAVGAVREVIIAVARNLPTEREESHGGSFDLAALLESAFATLA